MFKTNGEKGVAIINSVRDGFRNLITELNTGVEHCKEEIKTQDAIINRATAVIAEAVTTIEANEIAMQSALLLRGKIETFLE